jgi:hypothetical protein
MSLLNTVVPGVWIGGLTLVLIGRAVASWLRYRDAARYARLAARLARATEEPPTRGLTLLPVAADPVAAWAETSEEPAQPVSARRAEG